MKGVVFIAINDMIEEKYGIDVWEELLQEVQPKCEGIYTSTEDYPDEEVVAFVLAISKKLSIDSSEVTKIFGQYLFGELNRKYAIFTNLSKNLFDFLNSIEGVIHKEVRKLYHNPSLPSIRCEKRNAHDLRMYYQSPRKLCFLAEGLILGAAEYYNEEISLSHPKCIHKGEEMCELRIIKHG